MSHIFIQISETAGKLTIRRNKTSGEPEIDCVFIEHNFKGTWEKVRMSAIPHYKGDFVFEAFVRTYADFQYIFRIDYKNGSSVWVCDTDCTRFEQNKFGSLNTVVETYVNSPEVSGIYW